LFFPAFKQIAQEIAPGKKKPKKTKKPTKKLLLVVCCVPIFSPFFLSD
jgi:hypothetical protein